MDKASLSTTHSSLELEPENCKSIFLKSTRDQRSQTADKGGLSEGCSLACDYADSIPERQADNLHPGIFHNDLVEVPNSVCHFIFDRTRLINAPLQQHDESFIVKSASL